MQSATPTERGWRERSDAVLLVIESTGSILWNTEVPRRTIYKPCRSERAEEGRGKRRRWILLSLLLFLKRHFGGRVVLRTHLTYGPLTVARRVWLPRAITF